MSDTSPVFEGTLVVRKSKDNKKTYLAKYCNAKGKDCEMSILPAARCFAETDATDGAPLHVTVDGGQIKKVVIVGKTEIAPVVPTKGISHDKGNNYGQRGGSGNQRSGFGNQRSGFGNQRSGFGNQRSGFGNRQGGAVLPLRPATAPYNFVPQNRILAWDETTAQGPRYSGTLHCRLEALTPLLVCGAQDRNPTENEAASRHFCRVGQRPVIPGSSLKGMLRSLVEAFSCSSMRIMNEHRIFWRNFDDNTYKAVFNIGTNGAISPQKAGYLERHGADFCIYPVNFQIIHKGAPTPSGYQRVCTGPMPKKCHDYAFAPRSSCTASPIQINDALMADFFLQLTPQQENIYKRSESGIRGLKKDEAIPVFYVENASGELEFFGLPRFFRYPKAYSPSKLRDHTLGKTVDDVFDFSDILFGYARKTRSRKGRVASSPAFFSNASELRLPEVVLGQPHETCFAHYLQQDVASLKIIGRNNDKHSINSMNNYNKEGKIRGRKFYWHRSFDKAQLPKPPNDNKKCQTVLHPLKEGATAKFAVHLDSVTLAQLGAVLLALRLPRGHAHKLGMGKSLGLGSVRIEITGSNICADAEQYTDLVSRCEALYAEPTPAQELPNKLFQEAEDAFKSWVLKGFDKPTGDFEQLEHVVALRRMLDFTNRPANDKTKSMDLKEFRQLRVLQLAKDIT